MFLCRYEDLGRHPAKVIRSLYQFLRISYPGDKIVRSVHVQSVGKGAAICLSREVERLCDLMLQRLDALPKQYDSGDNERRPLVAV